jgi:hypothetical protein
MGLGSGRALAMWANLGPSLARIVKLDEMPSGDMVVPVGHWFLETGLERNLPSLDL